MGSAATSVTGVPVSPEPSDPTATSNTRDDTSCPASRPRLATDDGKGWDPLRVLAGILLRVRAFLYLGVTFLFVVIFSMIWHAAVGRGQMWLWWVSGIVLGAAIIALFAVFEQRRNDVLRMIEEMRKWD